MTARPSVIIGLGTTGSAVLARIYASYNQYLQRVNSPRERDIVQFISIDTTDTIPGAEGMRLWPDRFMIGVAKGDDYLEAMRKDDPFFLKWWYEDMKSVGSLYPGASTLPLKGRLAFWARLGVTGSDEHFGTRYETLALRAATAAAENGVSKPKVVVYLISTLSGGTGAGCFLDVAQTVRSYTSPDVDLHGIFILPDVVNLLAKKSVHERTAANGYGSLIALNYWNTEVSNRPIQITPFMRKAGRDLEGKRPVFDVSWLISRINANDLSMVTMDDYQQMVADSVSNMIFEEQSDHVQSRFNDFIHYLSGDYPHGNYPQPKRYGSFAIYAIRYHPEKALSYLEGEIGLRAIRGLCSSSVNGKERAKRNVREYMLKAGLCAKHEENDDETAQYSLITDQIVTVSGEVDEKSRIRLYPEVVKTLNSWGGLNGATPKGNGGARSKPTKTVLVEVLSPQKNQSSFENRFLNHYTMVKNGLEGELHDSKGVNYRKLLQAANEALFEKVVRARVNIAPNDNTQVPCLYQMIEWLLKENNGFEQVKNFLDLLKAEVQRNKHILETELSDEKDPDKAGDKKDLLDQEQRLGLVQDPVDGRQIHVQNGALRKLGNQVYGSFSPFVNRADLIKKFEREWWNRWLDNKVNILLKESAVAFYTTLEQEIDWLIQLVTEDCNETLVNARNAFSDKRATVYGDNQSAQATKMEVEAITDGAALARHFGNQLNTSQQVVREKINALIIEAFQAIAPCRTEELIRDKRRENTEQLKKKIGQMVQSETAQEYKAKLDEMSVWDAMAMMSDAQEDDPDRLAEDLEKRIRAIEALCSPCWQIDKHFTAQNLPLHRIFMYSYDQEKFEMFRRRHNNLRLYIHTSNQGESQRLYNATKGTEESSAVGARATGANSISPYEVKVVIFEGGAPLAFIEGVNRFKDAFVNWRDNNTEPSLLDKRYQPLINDVGIPTWTVEGVPHSNDVYDLLLAETMDIIDSPLINRLSCNGVYILNPIEKDGNKQELGGSRKYVFEQFMPEGKYHAKLDRIHDLVQARIDTLSTQSDIKQREHLIILARLNRVLSEAIDAEQEQVLQAHKRVIEMVLEKKFGVSSAEALKLIKEFNLNDEVSERCKADYRKQHSYQ